MSNSNAQDYTTSSMFAPRIALRNAEVYAPQPLGLRDLLVGGGGEQGFQSRVPPIAFARLAEAGITTVVALLGTDDVTRHHASVIAAARALRGLGLPAYCYTGG